MLPANGRTAVNEKSRCVSHNGSWNFQDQLALIVELQAEAYALGPEISALKERRGNRWPHQHAGATGIQNGVLAQVHSPVNLIVRPHDLVPVREIITDERPQPRGD